jgi:N4-gp56 family major capsid protein
MDITLQTSGNYKFPGTRKFLKTFELEDTKTDTTNVSGMMGQRWAKDVINFGEAMRRYTEAVTVDTTLVNTGARTLTLSKTTSGGLAVTTSKSEGSDTRRSTTELSNLDTVSITFGQSDFKQGDVSVTKEVQLLTEIDLVKQARYVVQNAIADDVDKHLASTTFEATGIDNIVLPAGKADVSAITSSEIFSVDYIPDAMAKIEENNFVPKYCFIHPYGVKHLRKSSQFTNAAEYGDDSIVKKGIIGDYLGLYIIPTTNAPTYSSGATDKNNTSYAWGTDGMVTQVVGIGRDGRKLAGTLAIKEKPSLSYEFEKVTNTHHIYYDQAFKSSIVQPKAVALIKTYKG